MSNIKYNIACDDSFSSQASALATSKFTIPMAKFYNVELSYDLHEQIQEIANKHLNVKKYDNTSHFHVLKTKKIENFYSDHIIYFEDFKLILTYKAITINKESQKTDTTEDIEDLDDLLTSLNKPAEIPTKNGVYKIADLVFYYEMESQEMSMEIINEIVSLFEGNLYQKEDVPVFHTIGTSMYGFDLKTNELEDVTTFDDEYIIKHYGPDFLVEYKSIIENLKTKSHGLFLFHGAPGTGKTTMIRQIISEVCNDKKIIYVPSYMVEGLAQPEFVSFLTEHKDAILVLEDAEVCLKQRDDDFGTQAVSNLLNLTNGLLNDSIKIQVIATFNMDKAKLDEALLRPGRLLNEWEFEPLTKELATELVTYLEKDIVVEEAMTVSEIYNYEEYVKAKSKKSVKKSKKKVGF